MVVQVIIDLVLDTIALLSDISLVALIGDHCWKKEDEPQLRSLFGLVMGLSINFNFPALIKSPVPESQSVFRSSSIARVTN